MRASRKVRSATLTLACMAGLGLAPHHASRAADAQVGEPYGLSGFEQRVPGEARVYAAELGPINPKLTGQGIVGRAKFALSLDQMLVTVDATGLAPSIMHMQYVHGFTDGRDAACPPAEADKNGDGIIDIIEAESYSGTGFIPLDEQRSELETQGIAYPVATGELGGVFYQQPLLLPELRAALKKRFGIDNLDLDRRVVLIHGVDPGTDLSASVRSLPGVAAHFTVPVLCGEIQLAQP